MTGHARIRIVQRPGAGARVPQGPAPAPLPNTGTVLRAVRPPWRLLAFACVCLAAGCSTVPKTPARLYDLDNAQLIHVKLFYFKRGYGHATAVLPDGGALHGRYAVAPPGAGPARRAAVMADLDTVPRRGAFARVYGYNRSLDSHPVGYGRLSSDGADITLTMVLYSVDNARGYGTGVARDNRGHWYRVHIGDLQRR